MATQIIKTTFKLRRGLAARWAEVNPILAEGEPGFELDTYKLKIGNGEKAWNDLPYVAGDITKSPDGTTLAINQDEQIGLLGYSSAEPGMTPVKGEDGILQWKKIETPLASAEISGIMKLYDSVGQNTDGTMTQKAISDELDDKVEIALNIEEEMIIFTHD